MHYLDTSALAKLIVREPETEALVTWVHAHTGLATSDLSRTELIRAIRRGRPDLAGRGRDLLGRIALIVATPQVFDAAARLDSLELRSLDAVHLASALQLGDELDSVVTYDGRLADAVRLIGIPVTAPA